LILEKVKFLMSAIDAVHKLTERYAKAGKKLI
jgi:hypothetical protein